MTQISMLSPSSHTNRSPVAECAVTLSTPFRGLSPAAASYSTEMAPVARFNCHTLLSPLVVKNSVPAYTHAPSPPLKRAVPSCRSGASCDVGTQVTTPSSTCAASSSPAERSFGVSGVNRYRRPLGSSSVRYTRPLVPSTAAASWANAPSASRRAPWPPRNGSHSQTRPSAPFSSQLSHVPHGDGPPEQLRDVPFRIEYASTIVPLASNRIADTPPPPPPTSELDTYTQPPLGNWKQAPPSGFACHRCCVPPTGCPEWATTRLVKPAGSSMPFESAEPSAPYGPGPARSAAMVCWPHQKSVPSTAAPAPAAASVRNLRRSMLSPPSTFRRPHLRDSGSTALQQSLNRAPEDTPPV